MVNILLQAGVTTTFGVVSVHNAPIFDAIARQSGIRLVPTRGEAGAVNMADGYARAGGRLGVAVTSTGTGAGNAMGSLIEAQAAGSPVLHLTGQIPSAHLDQGKGFMHEARDQLGMLRSVSKAAFRPASAAAVPATVAVAVEACLAPPTGPVSVELPIDYQESEGVTAAAGPRVPTSAAPDPIQVAQAADRLSRASAPLIWAGGGAVAAGAGEEIRALAERLVAGVLTSQAGRGCLPEDDPLCIGNFGSSPAAAALLEEADVLLAIGTHFRAVETRGWHLKLPPLIQVDNDPMAIGRAYPATAAIVADAGLALRALLERVPAANGGRGAWRDRVMQARTQARSDIRRIVGPHERLCDDLRGALPRDAILVRDMTIAANTWGARLLEVYEPRTSLHATAGGIGQGLPMAMGAKAARPERAVVVLCGDGGFQLNCGEMATATQEGLAVVAVVFNDGGYGILRNVQRQRYGSRFVGVDLAPPDFTALAAAFGWGAWRVESTAAFGPAVGAALASGRPALIEVDCGSIGEMRVAFTGPPLGGQP